MADGNLSVTAATPGDAGARHALGLAWRAAPVTNPNKFCITRSLDGEGNHIGWLIRQGGKQGEVLHTYGRGDAELTGCILTWALLRADPPEGYVDRDELRILKFLGAESGHRLPSDLDPSGIPTRAGMAGCLAKGWVFGRTPPYSPAYAWYRLTEEGERVASTFFPERIL